MIYGMAEDGGVWQKFFEMVTQIKVGYFLHLAKKLYVEFVAARHNLCCLYIKPVFCNQRLWDKSNPFQSYKSKDLYKLWRSNLKRENNSSHAVPKGGETAGISAYGKLRGHCQHLLSRVSHHLGRRKGFCNKQWLFKMESIGLLN